MRVTHIINDLTTGGAQTLIDGLAGHMDNGYQTSLVVLAGRGPLSDRLEESCTSVQYLNFARSSYRLDKLIVEVSRALWRNKPQVVHSHLLQSDLAAAFATLNRTVPRVSTVHTTGMSGSDPLRSRLLGRSLGALSKRFDAVVACGDTAAHYMAMQKYDAARSHIISNGVPVGKSWKPSGMTKRLVSLSRWHPMKDHRLLLASLAEARKSGHNFTLACAGSGSDPTNRELVQLVHSFGLESAVQLLGPVQDVGLLLEEADALVISSAYGEALPMAGLEALSMGVPVITTDVGDCSRLAVDDWMLVPPRNVLALATAFGYLWNTSELDYERISRAAWLKANEEFSIENVAQRYQRLYERLCLAKLGSWN